MWVKTEEGLPLQEPGDVCVAAWEHCADTPSIVLYRHYVGLSGKEYREWLRVVQTNDEVLGLYYEKIEPPMYWYSLPEKPEGVRG